ncbi:coiled-coil domain-containing protein 102A-like isoform X1 [Pecten maximus]|uniref:coiled-coil domain-containing protein 102A-like isoform X1 n=1 Tax=Pecten maximus TaxID=6579 RepID=UPI001459057E|nr:coiled-coil domain-containing protein 102A-like isoform X1 [Pecten maximus]
MSQKVKPGSTKGDVSYLRATAPPAGPPLPISPPPMREGNITPVSQMSSMDEWDDRDEFRMRELEEARARATQMEKTMRWWSDCTANWREKWSKVRNERNKAREENRQLRAKLEALVKECTQLKRERQEFCAETIKLKKQLGMDVDSTVLENPRPELSPVSDRSAQLADNSSEEAKDLQALSPTRTKTKTEVNNLNINVEQQKSQSRPKMFDELSNESDGSLAEEKKALYELKLDEAQKTLLGERDEKTMLMKSIEKLQLDLNSMKSKYEDLKHSKQDLLVQLNKIKDDHKEEISRITMEMDEESSNRSAMDKRLGELRRELERLQRENADEWGKRERLETEKYGLERENKKIRIQIEDLEEQLQRKTQQTSVVVDSDMRTLQNDLSEKNKELNDLRHIHGKLKKTLQEKLTELDHTKRRGEQYEIEVKKLRGRIEELKKDLANAEDEVDTQANMVRKLQRTNDELQEEMENLQVQLDHTQSRLKHTTQNMSIDQSVLRLKRSSQSALSQRAASLRSFDPNDQDDPYDSDLDPDDDLGDEP